MSMCLLLFDEVFKYVVAKCFQIVALFADPFNLGVYDPGMLMLHVWGFRSCLKPAFVSISVLLFCAV